MSPNAIADVDTADGLAGLADQIEQGVPAAAHERRAEQPPAGLEHAVQLREGDVVVAAAKEQVRDGDVEGTVAKGQRQRGDGARSALGSGGQGGDGVVVGVDADEATEAGDALDERAGDDAAARADLEKAHLWLKGRQRVEDQLGRRREQAGHVVAVENLCRGAGHPRLRHVEAIQRSGDRGHRRQDRSAAAPDVQCCRGSTTTQARAPTRVPVR
jgi:hypothetical protein